jgi:hypothetical protein
MPADVALSSTATIALDLFDRICGIDKPADQAAALALFSSCFDAVKGEAAPSAPLSISTSCPECNARIELQVPR